MLQCTTIIILTVKFAAWFPESKLFCVCQQGDWCGACAVSVGRRQLSEGLCWQGTYSAKAQTFAGKGTRSEVEKAPNKLDGFTEASHVGLLGWTHYPWNVLSTRLVFSFYLRMNFVDSNQIKSEFNQSIALFITTSFLGAPFIPKKVIAGQSNNGGGGISRMHICNNTNEWQEVKQQADSKLLLVL